jgi:hypothetical protein
MKLLCLSLLVSILLPWTAAYAQRVAEEHTLVHIKTPIEGETFHDVLVMAVINNEIKFVDVEELRNGDYVFTGPPGSYQIRVSTITNGRISVSTDSVRIGGRGPGPGPGPDPPPPPLPIPDDEFGNLGQLVYEKMAQSCSASFPRLALNQSYLEVARRLEGSEEPIIKTASGATQALQTEHDRILIGTYKDEWRPVAVAINRTFQQHSKTMDRAQLAKFMRVVAGGM